ncbi:MAG: inositol monophosphatase family protein [Acidimicrobiales bacterium]
MSTPEDSRQPSDAELLAVLHAAVDAISSALRGLQDWGLAGTREGQHHCDLAADAAALAVLDSAGLGVFSEESGTHGIDRPLVVVVDPVDGSTNASRGIPFYAASLCVLDRQGPRAAVVANLAGCPGGGEGMGSGGSRYEATRGGGARRDGQAIRASDCEALHSAIVGVNGWPSRYLGWGQYRSLGSAALELCSVAEGSLDGYCDASRDGLAPWDYMGALLICSEAGAVVTGVAGGYGTRPEALWVGEHRRSLVAAGTPKLAGELLAARRSLD